MEIALDNYNKILSQIQKTIEITKENINKSVNREKVLLSWNIGKIIEENLIENDRAKYGDQLIQQLEQDISISETALYQMRSFYKTYPKLQANEILLNWSHYRSLITIKDDNQREYFSNLALENSLNANDLQFEISQAKEKKLKVPAKKISPSRGRLFNYKLAKLAGSNEIFIDCGFKIFSKIESNLTAPLSVNSNKKDGVITLTESLTPRSKLYTYKASLEKVVDGDTLRVVLDLGFGIFHKEILRLKGINAAEMSTLEGKKSATALKVILKNIEFLIIKTNKIDIFGRYIADVFFQENESDLNKVAESGIYLNQLLLDRNLAEYQ